MSTEEMRSILTNLHTIRESVDRMKREIEAHISKHAVAEEKTEFRPASVQFNSKLSKEERHNEGIYFTPRTLRKRLLDILTTLSVKATRILEPSFGTGEFIQDVAVLYPDAVVTGVEQNAALYKSFLTESKKGNAGSKIKLVQGDFRTYKSDTEFDLILGNPPYFVVKDKNPACMTGRGNIFVQFLYKCLVEHLSPGGVLAFVLPTSFYNCSYYRPCRDYMFQNVTVLHVENVTGDFYDTAQDTMIMVVRKEVATAKAAVTANPYWYKFANTLCLTPFYRELTTLSASGKTLSDLGFSVKTGDVVWNQHKKALHDQEGTLVIYSSNIVNNELVLNNLRGEKKQRIKGFEPLPNEGPAILVARGYGNTYRFAYVLVPEGCRFHGENHINVITPTTDAAKAAIPRVMASLGDEKTSQYISMFVGNGAMSKTELEHALPIF